MMKMFLEVNLSREFLSWVATLGTLTGVDTRMHQGQNVNVKQNSPKKLHTTSQCESNLNSRLLSWEDDDKKQSNIISMEAKNIGS